MSCNTKTEGLCKNVNAYIRDESVRQEVSIDRNGYSQPVAANHGRILLRRAVIVSAGWYLPLLLSK